MVHYYKSVLHSMLITECLFDSSCGSQFNVTVYTTGRPTTKSAP